MTSRGNVIERPLAALLRRLANRRPTVLLFALLPPLPHSLPPLSNSPNHTVHQTKENVLLLAEEDCQFSPSSPRFYFPFLTFLFLLFILTRRSTILRPPHSPRISLATAICKPIALSVPLPPPNRHHPPAIIRCNNNSANPLRTYRAPSINHQFLFALPRTPLPPSRLLPMVSLHNLPNSCRNTYLHPPPNPNPNPSPFRNNNGLSIHGLLVA
jgi:hypothetical protein